MDRRDFGKSVIASAIGAMIGVKAAPKRVWAGPAKSVDAVYELIYGNNRMTVTIPHEQMQRTNEILKQMADFIRAQGTHRRDEDKQAQGVEKAEMRAQAATEGVQRVLPRDSKTLQTSEKCQHLM